jgi:hypothetical protein
MVKSIEIIGVSCYLYIYYIYYYHQREMYIHYYYLIIMWTCLDTYPPIYRE